MRGMEFQKQLTERKLKNFAPESDDFVTFLGETIPLVFVTSGDVTLDYQKFQ